jgi:acetate kinase
VKTVTGGTTPLEGLPGETTCGDLDPGIILYLAEQMKWGPEQINALLTQESGLSSMAQRPLTLSELYPLQKLG